ncbi:FAD-dependent oxidoreductase [Cupriavidus basilensis]
MTYSGTHWHWASRARSITLLPSDEQQDSGKDGNAGKVIVGAGVVGMTSAWRLAQDGHEVTVLERHDGPGEETSFANGGQLSYSYVAPLAGPGVIGKVPGWLLRRGSAHAFLARGGPCAMALAGRLHARVQCRHQRSHHAQAAAPGVLLARPDAGVRGQRRCQGRSE